MPARRSMILFIVISFFTLMMVTCEKITLKDDPLSEAELIKFSQDIKPIFNACTGCHDGLRYPDLKTNPYLALKNGNYLNVANPGQSILYVQLKNENSHSSRVTPDQLRKILQWIKQGAKNN